MRLRFEKCMQSRAFKNPTQIINDNFLKIDSYIKRIENSIERKAHNSKNKFIEQTAKLDSLSPLKTLTRGYCLIEADGKIVKKVEDLEKDKEINIRLVDGKRKAKII